MKTNRFLSFVAIIAIAFTFSFSQEEENIRTGVRIALINSATTSSYQEINQGFTIGGIVSIPIVNTITFNPGLSIGYRMPYKKRGLELWEIPISIPMLFQGMPFGGPMFYLEAGLQLDYPIKKTKEFSNRAKGFDFEPVLGFGWNINKNLASGVRGFYCPTGFFESGDNADIFQIELGLTYLF